MAGGVGDATRGKGGVGAEGGAARRRGRRTAVWGPRRCGWGGPPPRVAGAAAAAGWQRCKRLPPPPSPPPLRAGRGRPSGIRRGGPGRAVGVGHGRRPAHRRGDSSLVVAASRPCSAEMERLRPASAGGLAARRGAAKPRPNGLGQTTTSGRQSIEKNQEKTTKTHIQNKPCGVGPSAPPPRCCRRSIPQQPPYATAAAPTTHNKSRHGRGAGRHAPWGLPQDGGTGGQRRRRLPSRHGRPRRLGISGTRPQRPMRSKLLVHHHPTTSRPPPTRSHHIWQAPSPPHTPPSYSPPHPVLITAHIRPYHQPRRPLRRPRHQPGGCALRRPLHQRGCGGGQ